MIIIMSSTFFLLIGYIFISVMMGPTEIPSQSSEIIKIPTAHYEFGANFIDPKVWCNLTISLWL